MFDYVSRLEELSAQGFCCSQVLTALALELKGCDNPEVNREVMKAMSGLCGGIGGSGKDCGALTGGACAIGLFCGRGEIGEEAHEKLNEMVQRLVEWFENEYGSVECALLVGGDEQKRMSLCPSIMQASFENAIRIMLENDVEIG